MKRYLVLLGFLLVYPVWAEVGVIAVTDEGKHSTKEDFYHTFEYFITSPGQSGSKCQATRMAPHWFVTAAHCVKDLCARACSLQLDLLEAPVSAFAKVEHSTQNPTVFVHPGYQQGHFVKDDFALIRLDLNRAPKTYYRRATSPKEPHVALSEQKFTVWLAKHPRVARMYRRVLNPQLPPIAVFDNSNYELDRTVSVISIFEGKRQVSVNPNPVYYVKDLGYAYTQNFGIRKGMSGSGVMTNTGELIGIISAYVGADLYKGKEKVKHQEFFVFPVFNNDFLRFMQDVMGRDFSRVLQKDAYPYLARKTRKNFDEIKIIAKQKK